MATASKIISVRIPKKLYKTIREELSENKLSISEWLFLRINEHKKLLKKKELFEKYLNELQKVFWEGGKVDGESVVKYLRSIF